MMDKLYFRTVEWLIIIGLALMVTFVFVSTLFRFAGYGGIYWAEEVTRYVSVWVVFLGAGLGIRHRIHIGVDFIVGLFPRVVRQTLMIVTYILMIGFELVLLVKGVELSIDTLSQMTASLGVPMSYANAAVPVGAAIMLYETFRILIRTIRGKETPAAIALFE